MTARDFHADLAMSDRPEVVAAITAACHGYWPELLSVHRAHTTNDKMGADYWLEFPGCKMETLDAKVRRKDYVLRGDDRTACLELVANTRSQKPGWTVDPSKLTDWIIFYYIETGSSFVYSARQLRAAVIAHLPKLQKTGKPDTQSTKSGAGSYQSESLFVSHRELGAAIYRNTHKRLAA
ncbi:MAG: hypothetical protein V4446_08405 [Pseudomonadota bacterium]